jgi:hypothetical protein
MVSIGEIVNIVNLETLALFPNRALIKFKQDLTFDQPKIDQFCINVRLTRILEVSKNLSNDSFPFC